MLQHNEDDARKMQQRNTSHIAAIVIAVILVASVSAISISAPKTLRRNNAVSGATETSPDTNTKLKGHTLSSQGVEVASAVMGQPTTQPIPFPNCNACSVFVDSQSCNGQFGCLWNGEANNCDNGCLYPSESRCNSCADSCRWIGGSFSACIIKWDFIFNVCFVIDDSDSVTPSQWATIKKFFIIGVIEALTPPSCVLGLHNSHRICPSVGIVQYNRDSLVVIPENLAAKSPQYATTANGKTRGQFSICFAEDTILSPLQPNWNETVNSMQLGKIRSPQDAGARFTLRGVSRCVDLLSNTAAFRGSDSSLNLLVTQARGNPNGPHECFFSTCSVCGADTYHTRIFDEQNFVDFPECGPTFIDANQAIKINRPNSEKIEQYQIRNVLVLYGFGGVSDLLSVTDTDCLVDLVSPKKMMVVVSINSVGGLEIDQGRVAQVINTLGQLAPTPPCTLVMGKELLGPAYFSSRPGSLFNCRVDCTADVRCSCYVWRWNTCWRKENCNPSVDRAVAIGASQSSGMCKCTLLQGKEILGPAYTSLRVGGLDECRKECEMDARCDCYVFRGLTCWKKENCNRDTSLAVPIGSNDFSGIC